MILCLFALVSIANGQKADESPLPTLTVCEALGHAADYDGKIIRIRDRVRGSSEGAGFVGTECPSIYVTENKTWPSVIAWTMPSQTTFILHPVDFTFDWESSKRIHMKWGELRKHLPDRCIVVTYTGMFESWSREKATKRYPNGWVREIPGFGHLNAEPAQLVLKSADDVSAAPKCK